MTRVKWWAVWTGVACWFASQATYDFATGSVGLGFVNSLVTAVWTGVAIVRWKESP